MMLRMQMVRYAMSWKRKKRPHYEIAMGSAMRGLVQQISLGAHQTQPVRIVAFIAARPREGTSTVARNYAVALASQSNQKVLLIDAGPSASERYYSYDAYDASAGTVDTVVAGQLPGKNAQPLDQNVSVGRWSGNEGHPGAVKVMNNHSFWKNLLDSYDSLVIDAPSLRTSFDGIAVAAKADATVIVVEAEKTPQPVVEHLRNTLASAGAKTAGIVMNKRRFYIPARVYRKL